MSSSSGSPPVAHRLVIGTLSNYGGRLLSAIVAFFLTPFVLHHLGPARYSLWALIVSIVSYGSLLDLGIGAAVVRYVAERRASGDAHGARVVLATAWWLYVAIAAIGILLSIAIASLVVPRLPLSAADAGEGWWLCLLLGTSAALSLPCSIPTAALRGASRFDKSNLLNSAGSLINAGCTVAVLLFGGNVLSIALVNIAVMLAMQVPAVWMIRRVTPDLWFGLRDASRAEAGHIFSFSASVFTVGFADLFHSRTGEVVIGIFLPVRSIAPYALAKRLTEIAQSMAGQFSSVLPPLAAELNALGDRRRLQTMWMASTRLAMAIFAPMACALFIFAAPLLRAWAGPESVAGAPILMLLAPAYLFEIAVWPAASVLQASNRYHLIAVGSVCSGLGVLGLTVLFVPRLGIAGAALAILIPTAIESIAFVVPLTLRTLGFRFRDFLGAAVVPVAAPSAAMCVVLYAMNSWVQPQSMPLLGLSVLAGGAVYAAVYLLSSHTAVERNAVLRLAQSLRTALP